MPMMLGGSRDIPIPEKKIAPVVSPISGEQAFQKLKEAGTIPESAEYSGFNAETSEVSYTIPSPLMTGEEALQKLKEEGKIPQNATLLSYDDKTGEVKYNTIDDIDEEARYFQHKQWLKQRRLEAQAQVIPQEPPNSVKLRSGEYVSKEAYDKLPPNEQELLILVGVDRFNDYLGKVATIHEEMFEIGNLKLMTGEYVDRMEFAKLNQADQNTLMIQGIDAFNKMQTEKQAEFDRQNIEIAPDRWVARETWDILSEAQREEAKQTGSYTTIRPTTIISILPEPTLQPISDETVSVVEVDTTRGKVQMPQTEWDNLSDIKQIEVVLGREPALSEVDAYRLARLTETSNITEDDIRMYKALPFVGAMFGSAFKLLPGTQKGELMFDTLQQSQKDYFATYPNLKASAIASSFFEEFNLPAAKAMFYPQIEKKDITGGEWVATGISVALYTMPLWLPKVTQAIASPYQQVTARITPVEMQTEFQKTYLLAKDAGRANITMQKATEMVKLSDVNSPNYIQNLDNMANATRKSISADLSFVDKYASLDKVNLNSVKVFEKASGMTGLTDATANVIKTRQTFNKWLNTVATDPLSNKVVLDEVVKSRIAFTNALDNFGEIAQPRSMSWRVPIPQDLAYVVEEPAYQLISPKTSLFDLTAPYLGKTEMPFKREQFGITEEGKIERWTRPNVFEGLKSEKLRPLYPEYKPELAISETKLPAEPTEPFGAWTKPSPEVYGYTGIKSGQLGGGVKPMFEVSGAEAFGGGVTSPLVVETGEALSRAGGVATNILPDIGNKFSPMLEQAARMQGVGLIRASEVGIMDIKVPSAFAPAAELNRMTLAEFALAYPAVVDTQAKPIANLLGITQAQLDGTQDFDYNIIHNVAIITDLPEPQVVEIIQGGGLPTLLAQVDITTFPQAKMIDIIKATSPETVRQAIQQQAMSVIGQSFTELSQQAQVEVINITQQAVEYINKLQRIGMMATEIEPLTQTFIETQITNLTDTSLQTQIQNFVSTMTQLALQTETALRTDLIIATVIQPTVQPVIETVITGITPTPPPLKIGGKWRTTGIVKLPTIKPTTEVPAKFKGKIPVGTWEWRQGKTWSISPYPYDEIIYQAHPLPGTYRYAEGKGSARKTLQVLGGLRVGDADLRMGWAKVHLRVNEDGRISINFGGGKEAIEYRWNKERGEIEEYGGYAEEDEIKESPEMAESTSVQAGLEGFGKEEAQSEMFGEVSGKESYEPPLIEPKEKEAVPLEGQFDMLTGEVVEKEKEPEVEQMVSEAKLEPRVEMELTPEEAETITTEGLEDLAEEIVAKEELVESLSPIPKLPKAKLKKQVLSKPDDIAIARGIAKMHYETQSDFENSLLGSKEQLDQLMGESGATIEGLKDTLQSSKLKRLLPIYNRIQRRKDQPTDITLMEYQDITGKTAPHHIIKDKFGRQYVSWDNAIDNVATEYGYERPEYLYEALEQLAGVQDQVLGEKALLKDLQDRQKEINRTLRILESVREGTYEIREPEPTIREEEKPRPAIAEAIGAFGEGEDAGAVESRGLGLAESELREAITEPEPARKREPVLEEVKLEAEPLAEAVLEPITIEAPIAESVFGESVGQEAEIPTELPTSEQIAERIEKYKEQFKSSFFEPMGEAVGKPAGIPLTKELEQMLLDNPAIREHNPALAEALESGEVEAHDVKDTIKEAVAEPEELDEENFDYIPETAVKTGSVAFKDSGTKRWVIMRPPYDRLHTTSSFNMPQGIYKVGMGDDTSKTTLQVLGGKPLKDQVLDLGWALMWVRADGTFSVYDKETGKISTERILKPTLEVGLQKAELPEYRRKGLRVYRVNEEAVAETYGDEGKDFVAGHHLVYRFIPRNEVWVGKMDNPAWERIQVIHELAEKGQMDAGAGYDEAHDYANKWETVARENPKQANAVIKELLAQWQPLKNGRPAYYQKMYEPKPTLPKVTTAMLRAKERKFYEEAEAEPEETSNRHKRLRLPTFERNIEKEEVLLPSRYYLGRKLRMPSLSIKL